MSMSISHKLMGYKLIGAAASQVVRSSCVDFASYTTGRKHTPYYTHYLYCAVAYRRSKVGVV